jgi:TonB-dependent starch-binding outer membrane protein SusC
MKKRKPFLIREEFPLLEKMLKIMKLTTFLILVTTLMVSASVYSQNTRLSLKFESIPFGELFREIEKQTEFRFAFSNSKLDSNQKIKIDATDETLESILDKVLPEGIAYEIIDRYVVILNAFEKASIAEMQQQQQQPAVSGTVTDESGQPLPGVTVVVKGTTQGTVTNADGEYSLTNIPEDATLVFSFVGMRTQEVAVGNQSTINVELAVDAIGIEEVVAIGYGVQKKKLITGATIQVKGEALESLSTTNPISAIQSMSPGIAITQNNGLPDSGYKIYIRGIGTIGNSSPLVIIDGFVGGDLNSLNPSDIESIDVLKDAASSAIYGARAANGVILVTTKQGKAGKATITYDAYYGVQNVQKMHPTTNAQEYVMLLNEGLAYDGLPPFDYASQVPNWNDIQNGTFKGTNWLEEFRVKDAPIQNHSFNVTGGTEQSVYSLGFSYTSQDAIFGSPVNPNFDRYTARINTEHVLFRKNNLDIIKFGENVLFNSRVRTGQYDRTDRPWSNDFSTMFHAPPFLPVRDSEGNYSKATQWYHFYANPIGFYYYNDSQKINKNMSLLANAYLTIQPIRNLFLKSAYTYNSGNYASRAYRPAYDLGGQSGQRTDNQVIQNQGYYTEFMLDNTANYKFNINRHNFDILLGQSIQKNGLGSSIGGSNVNPILTGLDYAYLSNAKQVIPGKTSVGGSPNTRHQIASFFGRVSYDYKETYLFSAIMRADGSSNFAPGNRWGYFPSVSAGWILTNEPFLESTQNWMDFFKLRASFGQNGNESINNFQYLSTVAFSGADYSFGAAKDQRSIGAFFDILPNEDITWETSEQTNIGIDARFLNNRLGIIFDYYIKNTRDWLLRLPSLASNGTNPPFFNGGDIQNKGVELAVTWNDKVGDFTYGISANGSHNKNLVTRIANNEEIIRPSQGGDIGAGYDDLYRAEVGYPIAYFYGYKNLGIFQTQAQIDAFQGPKLEGVQPGDMIWVDTNDDGVLDSDDRTMIGNPHPKFTFGLGLNFGYKGFDLNVTGYGVAGNNILQNHRGWNDLPRANFTTDILNGRWHGEGTSNRLPRISSAGHTNWSWVSTQFMEKGDFFRMQNVTVGYDFKKLFKTTPFGQARLYITAQNLYTFTKYTGMDPEIGYARDSWGQGIDFGQFPTPRTFLAGVNLKF